MAFVTRSSACSVLFLFYLADRKDAPSGDAACKYEHTLPQEECVRGEEEEGEEETKECVRTSVSYHA